MRKKNKSVYESSGSGSSGGGGDCGGEGEGEGAKIDPNVNSCV